MRIWIDIENPPQVQYLTPLAEAFSDAGAEVVITARDYGSTLDLLRGRGIPFTPAGARYGRAKWRKAAGLVDRAVRLEALLRGRRPHAAVHAGRAASLVARRFGIPSFAFRDYEFVDLRVDRLTSSYVVHPDVIDPEAFRSRGVGLDRLVGFRGLKEDLSFASVDLDTVPAHEFPEPPRPEVSRLLFRPPAEESHYYSSESGRLSVDLLGYLAGLDDVQLLFSPRYPYQAEHLETLSWKIPPLVVGEALPFVPLLKAADGVVASGGTMAREAAYLGVPAFSIFRGALGGVDRYLESLGRLQLIRTAADFGRIRPVRLRTRVALSGNPQLREELVEAITRRVAATRRDAGASGASNDPPGPPGKARRAPGPRPQ